MISTYHTIFLAALVVSIVLLLLLILYIPVFHVFYAIGWLSGLSKRKEMQSYDENGMSAATRAVGKKTKSSKGKPEISFELSASAASPVFEESPGKASKLEKLSRENTGKSSQVKESATGQFAESITEHFEESSGTDLFSENPAADTVDNQRCTDIFSETSAGAGETVEETSRGTNIFAEEDYGTDIFAETAGDDSEYCGTDILSDKDEESAYKGTDILNDDKEDNDEIFISVGSEIPGEDNSSRDTELLEDGEV